MPSDWARGDWDQMRMSVASSRRLRENLSAVWHTFDHLGVLTMAKSLPYAKQNRLSDVMALIQVLGIDEHAHRSESGLVEELQ